MISFMQDVFCERWEVDLGLLDTCSTDDRQKPR